MTAAAETAAAEIPAGPARSPRRAAAGRQILSALALLTLLAALYSGYKAMGESTGGTWPVIGGELPVATNDLIMPPIGDILRSFGEPVQEGGELLVVMIARAAAFTLREAAVGLAAGAVVGFLIAVVLARSTLLSRGLLPYVVASQTIPLVAIAPIVVIWARTSLAGLPWEWQDWHSVALISTYLTFFPVTMNGHRGLMSPTAEHVDLMRSYAAGWARTLLHLRVPASLPYLGSGLRLAATASVVGAIVGEISAGVRGGLGRLILDFAGRYSTGPERLYASVAGAAALGLVVFGAVALGERLVLRRAT